MQFVMPAAKMKPAAPLTFDLPESLIAKIEKVRKGHGLGSASEVVRLALSRFDLNGFKPSRDRHRQISVRIAGATRVALRRTAKQQDASFGEIIRAALEELSVKASTKRKRR